MRRGKFCRMKITCPICREQREDGSTRCTCGYEFDASLPHENHADLPISEIPHDPTNLMHEKSVDLFIRSVCPRCDAWNNWDIKGDDYVCKSCQAKYHYTNGNLLCLEDGLIDIETQKTIESNPYYKILTTIDISNRDHWLSVFDRFEKKESGRIWNWPLFFFDVYWFFWKGLWKKGLVVYAALFTVGICFIELQAPFGLILIAMLPLKIYFGFTGSKDYYDFVNAPGTDTSRARKDLKKGRWLLAASLLIEFIFSMIGNGAK